MVAKRPWLLILSLVSIASSTVLLAEEKQTHHYSILIDSVLATEYEFTHASKALGFIDALRYTLPFNETTLRLRTDAGLGVDATLRFIYEYGLIAHHNVPLGFDDNPIVVENNALYRGVLLFPMLGGEIRIGRQDVSFGPSSLSNLQITQAIPFLDSVYYSLPIGPFILSQVIATLENRKGIEDIYFTSDQDPYSFESTIILLSSRRFSIDTKLLSMGIGAQSIASRANNALYIGDVLPIFGMHSADIGWHNFSLYLDGTFRAIAGHKQYCIIGLDDVNANAVGFGDGSVPTIGAFVIGSSGLFELGLVTLTYDLEGSATHHLWGSFYERHYLSKAIYRLSCDNGNITIPLTSPYGPARLSVDIKTRLDFPSTLYIIFDGLILYGDPSINLFNTAYEKKSVAYSFILGRLEATIGTELLDTVSMYIRSGLDCVPSGVTPRISIGGSWQVSFGTR